MVFRDALGRQLLFDACRIVLEGEDVSVQLVDPIDDISVFVGSEDLSEFVLSPAALEAFLEVLVGGMILLYLFVEGEDVLDLNVGEGVDETLVAVVIGADVFVDLGLALLIGLCQKTSDLALLRATSGEVLDQSALAGFLDGAGGAVGQAGVAIAVLGWLLGVVVAEAFLLGPLYLHRLRDVLEGE